MDPQTRLGSERVDERDTPVRQEESAGDLLDVV
jgi:hypothetical protein